MAGDARLTFDTNAGMVRGTAGGRHFSFLAASGGGGGAKTQLTYEDMGAVNNPLRSHQKMNAARGVRGGSIPAGTYRIRTPARHAKLGRAAALIPAHVPGLGTRGGFYIHGRGAHGSDGCIVPMQATNLHALLDAIASSGGGLLTVRGIHDLPDRATGTGSIA